MNKYIPIAQTQQSIKLMLMTSIIMFQKESILMTNSYIGSPEELISLQWAINSWMIRHQDSRHTMFLEQTRYFKIHWCWKLLELWLETTNNQEVLLIIMRVSTVFKHMKMVFSCTNQIKPHMHWNLPTEIMLLWVISLDMRSSTQCSCFLL